jgi:MFS transporter, Spinster family, sphingosine-1-phosphate transporter
MKFNKYKFNAIFTVAVFTALAALDNAVIGLFPPLLLSISKDLKIHISQLGNVLAANILVTSIASIFWGYAADKGKRKKLIMTGTVIWSVSVFLTAFSQNFIQLMVYQVFTGIGLGCIASIGYSVLTDYIPQKRRGMLMSLWGMSQGFGGIAGSVMASTTATASNWRRPFLIVAILGLAFIVLYVFTKDPKKGGAEPELMGLSEEGYEYNYVIKLGHIREIIMKKSNKWLIIQGFFMNITTGTLIWLPTLYISKIHGYGYSTKTSMIAASYLFALLQAGGLLSIYFGYLGDKFQKFTYRGRPLLAAASIFIAMPLYIAMFNVPMTGLSLPKSINPFIVFVGLVKEIAINPWMMIMFLLALGATAAQSANTPNWLALLTDVNLPEHRATMFSIANLVSGIGRAIGNSLVGPILILVSIYYGEPYNYIITMSLFQLFFIPAVISYLAVSRSNGKDTRRVKSILKRRARGE